MAARGVLDALARLSGQGEIEGAWPLWKPSFWETRTMSIKSRVQRLLTAAKPWISRKRQMQRRKLSGLPSASGVLPRA